MRRQVRPVSIIFDGSMLHELAPDACYSVLVRFVRDGVICQRVLRFQLNSLQKALTSPESAFVLAQALETCGVSYSDVLAWVCDGSTTNSATLDIVKGASFNAVEVGCFSRALETMGKKGKFSAIAAFFAGWNGIIASPKARAVVKQVFGRKPVPQSDIDLHWFSFWDQCEQLMLHSKLILTALTNLKQDDDICPASVAECLQVVQDPAGMFFYELATMVDVLGCFRRTCRYLEGDGFLSPFTYDKIGNCDSFARCPSHLNLNALLATVLPQDADRIRQHCLGCVLPCLEYFKSTVTADGAPFEKAMKVFKAAQLFHPYRYRSHHSKLREWLSDVPFVGGAHLSQANRECTFAELEKESARYLQLAERLHWRDADELDLEAWWSAHGADLPHFSQLAWKFALVQPSSAAIERSFGSGWRSEDALSLIEFSMEAAHQGAVMSRYNERKREEEAKRLSRFPSAEAYLPKDHMY